MEKNDFLELLYKYIGQANAAVALPVRPTTHPPPPHTRTHNMHEHGITSPACPFLCCAAGGCAGGGCGVARLPRRPLRLHPSAPTPLISTCLAPKSPRAAGGRAGGGCGAARLVRRHHLLHRGAHRGAALLLRGTALVPHQVLHPAQQRCAYGLALCWAFPRSNLIIHWVSLRPTCFLCAVLVFWGCLEDSVTAIKYYILRSNTVFSVFWALSPVWVGWGRCLWLTLNPLPSCTPLRSASGSRCQHPHPPFQPTHPPSPPPPFGRWRRCSSCCGGVSGGSALQRSASCARAWG